MKVADDLFLLLKTDPIKLTFTIPESEVYKVKIGQVVRMRTQAYPGEMFPGRLLLIGDVLDEKLRTVPGRVEVANSAGKLKAGMFVEAVLESAGSAPALAVPEAAVQDDDGRQIVFVQAAAGKFVRREIKTGQRSAGQVEVRQGLAAGETVVTSGSFLLKSEMRKDTMEDEHGHS
jgi:RND family efflux transporter MFP subunit